jgi:hypothetical protein
MNELPTIQTFIVAVLEHQAEWRATLSTRSPHDHRHHVAARLLTATARYARGLPADDPEFHKLISLPLEEIYETVRHATRAADHLPAEVAYLCGQKLQNIGFAFIDTSDAENKLQQMFGIRPLFTSPEGQVLNELICWFREVSLLIPLFRTDDAHVA